ncbi:MAG: hypothetical protein KC503_44360 [Myxococcales bacterium]|nr:hypothetical protein [Myxococcales bacterium]
MSRALLAAVICVGCAGQPLDRAQLEGRAVRRALDDVPVRGFRTFLKFRREVDTRKIEGELIAVDATHIWMLQHERLYAISRRLVTRMTIKAFAGLGVLATVWDVVGTLSAISHGYWAVISGPVWLFAGIPSAYSEAIRPEVGVALGKKLDRACQFARFPMGLPRAWLERNPTVIGARVQAHAMTGCGASVTQPPPSARRRTPPATRPTSQPASAPATRPTAPDEPGIRDDPKM